MAFTEPVAAPEPVVEFGLGALFRILFEVTCSSDEPEIFCNVTPALANSSSVEKPSVFPEDVK